MTLEDMEAAIASLRQQQENQNRRWVRWGLASGGIAVTLFAAVGIKLLMTGADPPPTMIFIGLTFVFLNLVFGNAGRGGGRKGQSMLS